MTMPKENVTVAHARELYNLLKGQNDAQVYLGNVEGKLNIAHFFLYTLEQAIRADQANDYKKHFPEHSFIVVFNACIFGFAHALVSSIDNLAMVIYKIYQSNCSDLDESAIDMETIWPCLKKVAGATKIQAAVCELRSDRLYQFIRDLRNNLSHHYISLDIAGSKDANFFDLRISMRNPRDEYRNLLQEPVRKLLKKIMKQCKTHLEEIIKSLHEKEATN